MVECSSAAPAGCFVSALAQITAAANLENYELVQRKLEELPDEQLKPPPLITGADLIAEGYDPGPRFAEMLAAVEDAQLEGRVRSREEALKMVREMWPR
jgi:poly(A) polymerase